MTGADCLVKRLISHGSDKVFGYPGATVMSLYEALRRHKNEISHIRTADEQGAAHAADGYARVSGRPGICISTSGPGATNLVTGIANAFMDSVPVIFITGNVERSLIGTDSFQEVDIVGITVPVTKYSFTIRDESELIPAIDKAYEICMSGRKGPVLIDIPKDILEAKFTDDVPDIIKASCSSASCNSDVSEIVKCLNDSKRPLALIGGGVKAANAEEHVKALCSKLNMPVCSSLMGCDIIPFNYSLNLGLVGAFESETLRNAIYESDCIIAIGTRFSNRIFSGLSEQDVKKKKLIHIDSDRAEINKVFECDYFVCCDCKAAVKMIYDSVTPVTKRPWTDNLVACKAKELYMISGERKAAFDIFNAVDNAIGSKGTIVTDVGTHQMYVASLYPFSEGTGLITSGGLGTMGFGLGASIGILSEGNSENVVLFTGDGSFGMNLNELYTLKALNLRMIIIVFNNRKLGMVYDQQRKRYGFASETKHSACFSPAKIARSFGLNGIRVRNIQELQNALDIYNNSDKSIVIDYIL